MLRLEDLALRTEGVQDGCGSLHLGTPFFSSFVRRNYRLLKLAHLRLLPLPKVHLEWQLRYSLFAPSSRGNTTAIR